MGRTSKSSKCVGYSTNIQDRQHGFYTACSSLVSKYCADISNLWLNKLTLTYIFITVLPFYKELQILTIKTITLVSKYFFRIKQWAISTHTTYFPTNVSHVFTHITHRNIFTQEQAYPCINNNIYYVIVRIDTNDKHSSTDIHVVHKCRQTFKYRYTCSTLVSTNIQVPIYM